jgi:hypothetical protein
VEELHLFPGPWPNFYERFVLGRIFLTRAVEKGDNSGRNIYNLLFSKLVPQSWREEICGCFLRRKPNRWLTAGID